MHSNTDVSQFFAPVVPDEIAPMVTRDDLARGVLVMYQGSRTIETRDGKTSKIHTFVTDLGRGKIFATWGTADLNARVNKLRPKAVVFLQYRGKHVPDDAVENEGQHMWTVNVSTVAVDAIPANVVQALAANNTALESRIAVEREKELERRRERRGNFLGSSGDMSDAQYADMVAAMGQNG